ncbi:CAP domain-containing protein [Streptomyces sp. Ru72]|uniref:CAP domain-containing protein n=1 Tax=Streptomyces sp. Ru72 TaxID=2080747 RepID=UPI000CDDAA7B|nr:CAP domain-containing protein [Streptomyces sp. Ru72]POX45117.1 CAP domain-containing protein [Streptomyces sp. Ru72]
MSKHRRTLHHRKAVIAAVAIAAVGVPSVAMACADSYNGRPHTHRSHHHRHNDSGNAAKWHWAKATGSPTAQPKPSASATTAPATRPTASSAPASSAPTTATARVVALVNSERAKVGCAPLTVNSKLTKAAQAHSADMAAHQNMSHTGSDGSSPGDRITSAGYSWSSYGENIAYGYSTPESVMAAWMASPGHKRNILDCGFKEIGVGLAQPGSYWTQDFGTAR